MGIRVSSRMVAGVALATAGVLSLSGCSSDDRSALDLVKDLNAASILCEPIETRVKEASQYQVGTAGPSIDVPEVNVVECQTPGAAYTLTYWSDPNTAADIQLWVCASLLSEGAARTSNEERFERLKGYDIVLGSRWLVLVEPDSLPSGEDIKDAIGGQSLKVAEMCDVFAEDLATVDDVLLVPNVDGLSLSAAEEEMMAAGLESEVLESVASSRPDGSVIGQSVPGGSLVDVNERIGLTISAGTEVTRVPRLIGLTSLEDVSRVLKESGLILGRIDEVADTAPWGVVMQQSPQEGAPAESDSAVDIFVSSGAG